MNVVLIVIDTLRADHLSCYGYFRNTSPTIDRLAREGVLFENFYASGIATGPGFTSIVTGRYPTTHKYYITPYDVPNAYQLDDNIPVLAEIMWDNGFVTAAVDNLINFRSHMKHFVRGYEYYMNPTKTSRWVHHHLTADQANNKALPWIRSHSYEKFFLFIHYWDPHTPYNQPEAYRSVFRQKNGSLEGLEIRRAPAGYDYVPGWGKVGEIVYESGGRSIDLYDGEILYVDNAVAQVVEALKEERILDETMIIITSDHGEGLGQHGLWGHAGLHETIVRVPLIIRFPEKLPKGLRVKEYAQHADIVPTILDYAAVPSDAEFDGESLRKLVEGGRIRDFAVCETWGERCIISGEWKLIVHYPIELKILDEVFPPPIPRYHFEPAKTVSQKMVVKGERGYELYNLKRDPMETVNLADDEPDILKELEKKLDEWVKSKVGEDDPMKNLVQFTQPQPVEWQRI